MNASKSRRAFQATTHPRSVRTLEDQKPSMGSAFCDESYRGLGRTDRSLVQLLIFLSLFWSILNATSAIASAQIAPSQELYAPNLGIYYQLVSYGEAYGAKLTKYPVANSPVGDLFFEPGDMIVKLDGTSIKSTADVLGHSEKTTVEFVNVQNNKIQTGTVFILSDRCAKAQQLLSRDVADDLQKGIVTYKPPIMSVQDGLYLWKRAGLPFEYQENHAVQAQCEVEIIKKERSLPHQRAFWDPYLKRMERLIAVKLFDTSLADNEFAPTVYSKRFDAIYREAMAASAASVGLKEKERIEPEGRAPFTATLINRAGNPIFILPLVKYRIAKATHPTIEPQFMSVPANMPLQLLGYYSYVIQLDQARRTAAQWISIDRDGDFYLP